MIPTMNHKLFVAVTEDNTTIKSVEDLTPDMKVAAQTGTTGASKVQELKDDWQDQGSCYSGRTGYLQ